MADEGPIRVMIVDPINEQLVDDAPGSPIVAYWEFYNEPDNRDFWGHAADEYAELLAAVYPVVKAANPEFPG